MADMMIGFFMDKLAQVSWTQHARWIILLLNSTCMRHGREGMVGRAGRMHAVGLAKFVHHEGFQKYVFEAG